MPTAPSALQPRKRQWGAERRSDPLSIVPAIPSGGKIIWGRIAILITILAWFLYLVTTVLRLTIENPGSSFRFHLETFSYALTVTMLTFSATMYLLARQGALVRFRAHRRTERAIIDEHFSDSDSDITVLIPCYDEEPEIVRYTLWSAALQEFPSVRVVLLIDDNPEPNSEAARERLNHTRGLTEAIAERLAEPAAYFAQILADWEAHGPAVPGPEDSAAAAGHYEHAAEWLERFAGEEALHDHVSEFFVEQVLLGLASELRLTRLALQAAADQREAPPAERLTELLRRLSWIFRAELCFFERKRYASLSNEPNKAMNLNSYISLMGGVFRQESTDQDSCILVRRGQHEATEPDDLVVPDSRYLLTLDADSQLLRDYCLRLVYLLEQPENDRIAVTQTPYSSFRGAPTRIERIAGATTDLQYQLHQGMTHYDATFWVGANAVIRKEALGDIAETETVGGFTITTYVQDRTVIEDTESSIDLGTHGWSLRNYPERLSYSATPPDFGSLVVQRRRWANGGLLIMPKFFEQIRARRGTADRVRPSEWMLRTNYMVSITWASLGLLFLLFYPYDSRLLSPLVFVAALPYFICMGADLRSSGHRFSDIFRIYGFNLVLLPVNLAGVAKSIQQAITGEKIPFARTPKVASRTAAPALYVAIPYAIVIFSVITAYRDFNLQNWGNAAFAAFNAVMGFWAIYSYIGLKNSVADIVLGVVGWLYVPIKPKRAAKRSPVVPKQSTEVDWRGILYHGDRRLSRDLRRGGDRRRRHTPERTGAITLPGASPAETPEPTATEVIRVLFSEAEAPTVDPGDSYGRPPRNRFTNKRRSDAESDPVS